MSISLNKPTAGTPNWAALINANWTTIESCFNGGTGFGPVDLSEGQINNLRIQNVDLALKTQNVDNLNHSLEDQLERSTNILDAETLRADTETKKIKSFVTALKGLGF